MALDPVASAALDGQVIKPVFFGFIDFANEEMRVNTSGADIVLTGTGEPDIDGFIFDGLRADVVDISPVLNRAGGTEGIKITLSGLPVLDADLLTEIMTETNWQGREIRLWRTIRDANNVQQGGIAHYYTGNMVSLNMPTAPDSQKIEVTVESYLAAFTPASNRSYLDQEKYDAGDLSARAAIAIANNVNGGSPAGNVFTPSGGGGGGDGFFDGGNFR